MNSLKHLCFHTLTSASMASRSSSSHSFKLHRGTLVSLPACATASAFLRRVASNACCFVVVFSCALKFAAPWALIFCNAAAFAERAASSIALRDELVDTVRSTSVCEAIPSQASIADAACDLRSLIVCPAAMHDESARLPVLVCGTLALKIMRADATNASAALMYS